MTFHNVQTSCWSIELFVPFFPGLRPSATKNIMAIPIQKATFTQLRVRNASSNDIPKKIRNTVKLAGSLNSFMFLNLGHD